MPITDAELNLMASAASIGDSSQPVNGYSTSAAMGMPSALYRNAKLRFWRMLATVTADSTRGRDAAQVAFYQRDLGTVHRHIGAGAHGDADIGAGERGGVVDAVAVNLVEAEPLGFVFSFSPR